MKVSKRDIYLLIGFAGVLLVVCAFFWIYQPTMEKVEAMEAQNRELDTQIAELGSKMENRETYETKTREMSKEMNDILQLFPVDVREEDAILLTLTEELLSPMTVLTLTMDANEPVEFELWTQESEDAEAVNTGEMIELGLYRKPVTMQFAASYDAMKRYVKTVVLQTNRTGLVGLTASYEETTGLLACVATLDMFYITGQEEKTYVQPDFSSVITGTDNPFGSVSIPYEEDFAALAEELTGIEVEEDEDEDEDESL